jgi:thiamine-phosphate diphosphorylase
MSTHAHPIDPEALRARLASARLMLVFTPELCGGRAPLAVLEQLLGEVDVVQVRPKPAPEAALEGIAVDPPAEARASYDWTARVLELAASRREAPPILVNDRVDVAMALADAGCAGVHLGQDDLPPERARELLGDGALIGRSTHDALQVVNAQDEPVDYLGFGPVFATSTKGYARGLGPEAAWIAAGASARPLFAIGGVTLARADELERVGRAAVGAALLQAEDPAAAARALREMLGG